MCGGRNLTSAQAESLLTRIFQGRNKDCGWPSGIPWASVCVSSCSSFHLIVSLWTLVASCVERGWYLLFTRLWGDA